MDSPPPPPKRTGVAAVFSSPTPSKSPEMQESPFSHFISNLSPISLLKSVQISCPEKEVQSFHSSGCAGESLANPVEVDGINSADPRLQSTKEVCQLLPSGYTGSKDTIKKVDNAVDSTREAGGLTSLYQAENNLPFLSSHKMVETAFNLSNGEMFDEFSTSENNNDFAISDMNLDPVSGVQYCGGYVAQNVGAQLDYRNGICQSFPEPLQIDEAFKNSDEILKLSKEYYKVPNYLQHGSRRHLHFEPDIAYKSVATGNTANSWDSLINSKNVVVPHGERRTISNSWESGSYAQSITSQSSFCPFEVVRSTQTSGNSAILGPLTSGIGLHENSIGRSVVLDSDMFASKNSTGYLSSQDKLVPEGPNSISISAVAMTMFSHADVDQQESQAGVGLHVNSIGRSVVLDLDMFASKNSTGYLSSQDKLVPEGQTSISISAVAMTMFSHADVDQQESRAGVVATSAVNSLNHPCDSFSLTQIEQQVASGEGRMSTSQNADSVEELNQVCPARKRKRAANKRETDGCKQCNCKRSKCLKLYCECFTAGVYCVDSCACENCFNKPEYDDLVLDTRQQIESRNPLAFTSKIITHATDSSENVMEEGAWKTPSSSRHKRGCNCKKSKCHQRYCECYQAKVGCSDACRCEGCQNSFGKKTAYRRAERCDKPSYEKLDDAQGGKDWSMDQYSPTWEGLAKLNSLSNSSFHDRMEVDAIPAILKDTTYSTPMALKARSPNQKQVFPPRLRSERQRSSSPPGMSCGRKLSLQAVSSSPSLTPYGNSEEGDGPFRNDQTDSTGNH